MPCPGCGEKYIKSEVLNRGIVITWRCGSEFFGDNGVFDQSARCKIKEQNMPVKPIRPEEVVTVKTTQIPDEVIEAFNTCIAKHFAHGRANFTQKEVMEEIFHNMLKDHSGFGQSGDGDRWVEDKKREIFANHWLDIEDIYRQAGWSVEYDPAYCETYDSNFTFTRKK